MSEAWVRDSIHYFRTLGFFEQYRHMSEDALASYIRHRIGVDEGEVCDPSDWREDLLLLSCDHDRVWRKDLEADVARGANAYVRVLQEWARISRGMFRPTQIEEHWEGETGPMTISFELDGVRHELREEYAQEAISVWLIADLNRIVGHPDLHFEMIEPDDQTATVLVLTPEEREQLKRDRGWSFEDWPVEDLAGG